MGFMTDMFRAAAGGATDTALCGVAQGGHGAGVPGVHAQGHRGCLCRLGSAAARGGRLQLLQLEGCGVQSLKKTLVAASTRVVSSKTTLISKLTSNSAVKVAVLDFPPPVCGS